MYCLTVASLMVRFIRSTWPFGPGVLGLGQPMIDLVEGAGVFEGMRVEDAADWRSCLFDLSRRPCFASGVR